MQYKHLLPAALAVTAQAQMMNLTALIGSNQNLSALGTVLQAYPQVVASLANATNVTLFAPSNNALQAAQMALSSASPDMVAALLSYHVLQGTFYASNISATPAFPHTTLTNATYSNVTGGQVVECRTEGDAVNIISGLKTVANVTEANLNFTGGVVHVIDSVLQIPGNFSSVAEAANLTALLGATTATNLTDTIDGLSDVTIFAPSNSAFQAIGSAAANLTAEQAAGILQYHVINGTIAYSSSLSNASIPTLGGGNVTVSIANGTVSVNGARVVNPDILISGGVVHIIDAVLNPNDTMGFAGASSATDVPFTSGVPAPTSTNAGLVTSQSSFASGYSTVMPAGGSNAPAATGGSASSSSSGIAAGAMPTGAIGAAALFGGAAILANL